MIVIMHCNTDGYSVYSDTEAVSRIYSRQRNVRPYWCNPSFSSRANSSHPIIAARILGRKAYDKILLAKMYNYEIRGIVHNWFSSYLTDRKQYTVVGNNQSLSGNITCGVPQGSVLGPLLFLLYVNDMQNAVSDIKIRLFADDTNLSLHFIKP